MLIVTSPRLPPELWLDIFSLATLVPGALDTKDHNAITAFTRDSYGIHTQRYYKASMYTKFSISLVCRSWNFIVSRHLLEYILITSGAEAIHIANLLEAKPARGYGTIRLEVALEGIHIWASKHTKALISIIRTCSNITCFSTIFSTTDAYYLYSSKLLDALADTASRITPIRRLELKADVPIVTTLVCALSSSLQVLCIHPSRRISMCSTPCDIYMPRLRVCISAFYQGGLFQRINMPRLETLITNDRNERDDILQRHGETIRNLSTPNICAVVTSLQHCTNLKELTLSHCHDVLSTQTYFEDIHCPTVSALTLEHPEFFRRLCTYRDDEYAFSNQEILADILASLVSPVTFPSLRRLRFVLPSPFTHSHFDHVPPLPPSVISVWKNWMNYCQELNICAEVAEGSHDIFIDAWRPLTLDILQAHTRVSQATVSLTADLN